MNLVHMIKNNNKHLLIYKYHMNLLKVIGIIFILHIKMVIYLLLFYIILIKKLNIDNLII